MRPFSPWRFVIVGSLATLLWWAVLGCCWLLIELSVENLAGFAGTGVVFGLIVAACWYLVLLRRSLAGLRLSAEELQPLEELLLETPGSMTHVPAGSRLACGGKLFLTNRRLVFKTHGGQHRDYQLSIDLAQIERAETFAVQGLYPNGVRVMKADGTEERFNLGLVNQPGAAVWVETILDECPSRRTDDRP